MIKTLRNKIRRGIKDTNKMLKMEHIFELFKRYCFQGHTHIPGVFTMM